MQNTEREAQFKVHVISKRISLVLLSSQSALPMDDDVDGCCLVIYHTCDAVAHYPSIRNAFCDDETRP